MRRPRRRVQGRRYKVFAASEFAVLALATVYPARNRG